jgi:hypothetical protein
VTKYVILIHGLVNGQSSPYDGTYLSHFDFDDCEPHECNLMTAKTPEDATRFDDVPTATEIWKTIDPRQPVRLDGKPNRPLTAFSVSIEPVGEAC